MPARYRVEHHTTYVYSTTVALSQHQAYLQPRELPYQRVHQQRLNISPEPAHDARRLDYFGNTVAQFQILRPHIQLDVSASSVVEVERGCGGLEGSLPWERVRDRLRRRGAGVPIDVRQFTHPSPYVPLLPDVLWLAERSFAPGVPLLDGAVDLMRRIHAEFAFDPSATEVTTPLTRVLESGRGVCQDFAHVAIAGLRALGLAARYVSGYLLTDPPPGQPRLVGADVSHAWFAVHCPTHGWIDLDPTNDVLVGNRHVTVAWGRDYGDVAPLRGVLLGGAEHTLFVGVTVVPFGDATPVTDVGHVGAGAPEA